MKIFILVLLCAVACVCSTPQQQQTPSAKKYLDLNGRILGGSEARPGQFPWQAAVYYDTSAGSYFCGGALIHPQWVLTAGQCVYGAQAFTVRLGSYSLTDLDPNKVEFKPIYSVVHPRYNSITLENDVGLIKLNTPANISAFVQVIPLASTTLGAGIGVTVSGWGATGDWNGAVNYLNYVKLSTISLAQCRQYFQYAAVTEGMLCAVGRSYEGPCNDDIGGPLVTTNANGAIVHAGIVSWASRDGCKTLQPSGFTRTSYYIDWIRGVIRD